MGKAPKILMFIDQMGSGGAQRQMAELAKGFREKGVDVGFLVYHDSDFYSEALDGFHVELIADRNYAKRFFRLRRYIRQGGFDAVLSFLTSPNVISCLSGIPSHRWRVVVGERNASPSILGQKNKLLIKAYKFADFVTANSYTNMELVRKVLPRLDQDKSAVIYNIVDFERFHFGPEAPRNPDDRFTIVVAARHHQQKNLEGLIAGVDRLDGPCKRRLRIEWYGDNSEGEILKKGLRKIEEYGLEDIFGFNPPVKNIEEAMAEADAVGLFSFYEGLPNAIIEGMAMGKPVVASAVSDVPRLIGEKKLLCDPNDPGSIAAALEYLISLPEKELERIGSENHRRALELFDKERILDQYLKILLP